VPYGNERPLDVDIEYRYIEYRYHRRKEPEMMKAPSRASAILTRLATLLLVVAIGFGALILVGGAFGFTLGGEIAVHTPVDGDHLSDLPPGAIPPSDVDVTVRVRHPTHEEVRWFALRDVPELLLLIAMLWVVRAVLRSVRDGDPFNGSNVRRLRGLALLVLAGIPAAAFVKSILAGVLAASVGLARPSVAIVLPGAAFLGALALLVLSEVFAEGVRMRDDLEGTI
jgi:hypothetical protein